MTPKRAARIAVLMTLGAVGVVSFGRAAIAGVWDLLINAPFLTALLGAPLAAAAGILTYRWRTATDSPETDVARSGDEWIAAVRSELAAVEDPRERRHSARAVVVVAVVRRTFTPWTWLLAGCVAVALALGLLALSRARVGDGVGDFTLLVPPLVFFAVGAVAAKRLGSFSRGLVVAAAVAVLSAVAMLPVAATEAARLYSRLVSPSSTAKPCRSTRRPPPSSTPCTQCSSCSTSSSGSRPRARRPAGSSRQSDQPAVPAWRSGISPVRV